MVFDRSLLSPALALAACIGPWSGGLAFAQEAVPEAPATVAEASAWTRTSTHDEVLGFLDRLRSLPRADRLVSTSLGSSGEGRELRLVIAADPPCADADAVRSSRKLRVLVNANIHAGEVEGKTAVQMLLRELASGEHSALLERAVLLFVPDFNPDGNDRIGRDNRASQNGPADGVGTRANAAGLDLNRDFVKAESPEVRALLGAFVGHDPQLFVDLHTTNGSAHGYHLTYAPSLSTNVDPALDRFARDTFLPEVRRAMSERHGFRVYDYGNFPPRGERSWSTYDHRPRFGTNYYGLRNRLGLLSEAYSYLDFAERVRVTRAFVLESVACAARYAAAIEELCEAADRRLLEGGEVQFGFDTALAPSFEDEVLVGRVRREGRRRVAEAWFEPVRMPVQAAFRSRRALALPAAWAVPDAPEAVREALLRHGVEVERLAAPADVEAEVFVPSAVRRAPRPFQGRRLVTLEGALERRALRLPVGTLLVRARQRLGRLAAQLLEAQSEDSLATWGVFDAELAALAAAGSARYPVVRLPALPAGLRR